MAATPDEVRNLTARIQDAKPLAALRDQPRERTTGARKYRNVVVEVGGIRFDSKAEHRRWVYLAALQKAGEIRELALQVPFELIPAQARPSGGKERPTVYIADFTYRDAKGALVVEDVKGAVTPEFRLKRKLLLWRHGIEVREIRS